MVGSLLIHPWAFSGLFVVLVVLGLREYYGMSAREYGKWMPVAGIAMGIILFLSLFLGHHLDLPKLIPPVMIGIMLLTLILTLYLPGKSGFDTAGRMLLGTLYVALPLGLASGLVYGPLSEGYNTGLLLFVYLIIWIYDSAAYLSGMAIGRTPLFKRVTPKKTIEGLAGGTLLTLAAAWAMRDFFEVIPDLLYYLLTLLIILSGTFGDFFESWIKRSAGVKDSGTIMPGHGGILDRLDSLLFAIPVVYITILIYPLP